MEIQNISEVDNSEKLVKYLLRQEYQRQHYIMMMNDPEYRAKKNAKELKRYHDKRAQITEFKKRGRPKQAKKEPKKREISLIEKRGRPRKYQPNMIIQQNENNEIQKMSLS